MRQLTRQMRDVLIEHLDCGCPVVVHGQQNRLQVVRGLLQRGFLRTDRCHHPRQTFLTERGREELAAVLADWADALTRAEDRATERKAERADEALEVAE